MPHYVMTQDRTTQPVATLGQQNQINKHIAERVVQMVIFLLLSAAPKRILLYKIRCASVQHSLSPPESFIVVSSNYPLLIAEARVVRK